MRRNLREQELNYPLRNESIYNLVFIIDQKHLTTFLSIMLALIVNFYNNRTVLE